MAKEKENEALESDEFFINTSAEMRAVLISASDGRSGRNYSNDEYGESRVHRAPGASHSVSLELTTEERLAGLTADTLVQFTQQQDADAAITVLYIAHLLASPGMPVTGVSASGLVDFDDVISKIGWDPRSSEERRQMHKRIYQFIQFGERAQVTGKRRGVYREKHSQEEIDTYIRTPLWKMLDEEMLDQRSLFPQEDVPIKVVVAMSHEWTRLLTNPRTAQFLPLGEILGAIPGNKPSGAWARIIGLALASYWRRHPRESISGDMRPTRRELLEEYEPKTGSANEVLGGANPQRAIAYWCEALQILKSARFLADIGEVTIPAVQMRKSYGRQGWGERWLNERVHLEPGEALLNSLQQRKAALEAIPRKKMGRPRKVAP